MGVRLTVETSAARLVGRVSRAAGRGGGTTLPGKLLWKLDPSIAITLGVVTGVAGGILRDVLTGEIPLVFRPEIRLYATAALVGAGLFLGLERLWPGAPAITAASTACILILRLAAIRWNLALPVFHPPQDGKPPAPL